MNVVIRPVVSQSIFISFPPLTVKAHINSMPQMMEPETNACRQDSNTFETRTGFNVKKQWRKNREPDVTHGGFL